MRLVLFDVDDTLVKSHLIQSGVYNQMFNQVYGVDASLEEIYSSGKTTQRIVEEILAKHGIAKKEVLKKINKAINNMADTLKTKKLPVLPGVRKVLNALSKNKNIKLGVVSGSAGKKARIILENNNLLHFFKIQSFGDHFENRKQIIENAMKKAKLKDAVLVGDSVNDVKVARLCRIKIVAVATSPETSYSRLKKMKPDFLFRNMSNHKKVVKVLSKIL